MAFRVQRGLRVAGGMIALSLWLCPLMGQAAPLAEILQRGRLRVAVKDNLPPLGFRDHTGTLQGFEISLARRLAQTLLGSAQAVDLLPVTNLQRLTAVSEGTVDLAIAHITLTEARRRQVSFSEPYYRNGTGILTRSPKLNTLQGLNSSRLPIAVLQPSITLVYLKPAIPKAVLKGVTSYRVAFQLLEQGQVGAVVGDGLVLEQYTRKNSEFLFFTSRLTVQPLVIALPKGVQYEPLRLRLNAILQQWHQDGWLEQQRQFWQLPLWTVPSLGAVGET